jgi:2-polyprenyl-3-methyl-5-hydroxy-6-metoxy-1,4-benzoquinol methylase
LRNLINHHDFFDALRMLSKQRHHLSKIFSGSRSRVVNHWNSAERSEASEFLQKRSNLLVSGNPELSRYQYVSERYLSRGNLIAVSIGCGDGRHEIEWAKLGVFKRIDGIDIADARIELAKKNATHAGVDDICHFFVSDLDQLVETMGQSYDAIIFESSLHHLAPMSEILERARSLLIQDGLVLLFDYVGPTKWQWLPQQLLAVNGMIDLLPERYKRLQNGDMLRHRFRPSQLRMYLMDPSEAIESEKILPNLRAMFKECEFRNAGGSLLNHFLPKIQHNFDLGDDQDKHWLELLCALEDQYIDYIDDIGIWYGFGVYQNAAANDCFE